MSGAGTAAGPLLTGSRLPTAHRAHNTSPLSAARMRLAGAAALAPIDPRYHLHGVPSSSTATTTTTANQGRAVLPISSASLRLQHRPSHHHQRGSVQTHASATAASISTLAAEQPALFRPLQLRGVVVPNRVFLSPMCMYSADEGLPNHWHLVHLGSRASGGCGLVMAEATAVVPEGRISPSDTGLWNEEQVQAWRPIVEFIRSQGAVPAIQLAHAGRKASTAEPTRGSGAPLLPGKDPRGWPVVGPSPVAFAPGFPTPREMTAEDIQAVIEAFAEAAKRALRAGFQVIELHMAHGYLLHQFLSPVSNRRNDQYGGSLENRMRLPLQVAEAVRAVLPDDLPLLVRISATDWGGPLDGPSWDVDQSVELVRALQTRGSVDLVDVSSGGTFARPPSLLALGPGYQVPFAERIRRDTGVPAGAVGLITEARQAEDILRAGKADAIFLARVMLRDPHWALRAAAALGGAAAVRCPPQYERGFR